MTGDMENAPGADDPSATLAAWRAQGADRLNPIRFHFIEALSRRAAVQRGYVRRVLDEKLAKLLQAYKQDVDAAGLAAVLAPEAGAGQGGTSTGVSPMAAAAVTQAPAARAGAEAASAPGRTGPLAELLGNLAAHGPGLIQDGANAGGPSIASAYPELALLDYFRDTWSRYSTKRQLKQSQERVPENAGPLNSSLLVHRTLSLMREVSPEYLHQFLSYVDALSWMEQATRFDLVADREGGRGSARKPPRASR